MFDKVIAFDNFRQKMILIVNMSLDDVESGYDRAVRELRQIADCLGHQAICLAYGVTITYAKELMHGKRMLENFILSAEKQGG